MPEAMDEYRLAWRPDDAHGRRAAVLLVVGVKDQELVDGMSMTGSIS